MTFYKFTIPSFTQFIYAWAELTENAKLSDDFPKCNKCGLSTLLEYDYYTGSRVKVKNGYAKFTIGYNL